MSYITQKSRRKLKTLLLIPALLVLAVVLGSYAFSVAPAYTPSSSSSDAEMKKLEDSLSKAAADRNNAKQSLNDIQSKQRNIIEQKNAIDNELRSIIQLIDISEEIIEQYNAKITETELEILDNELLIRRRSDELAERVIYYHEQGNASFLEILLTSSGIMDFFMRLDTVQSIMECDRTMINEYSRIITNLESKKLGLLELKTKAEDTYNSKSIQSEEYEKALKESENFIKELENDVEAAAIVYAEAQKSEAELNQQLEQKIASAQKKSNSVYTGGSLIWPLPSQYTFVSSGFGNRAHPVTGKPQFHTSVDIPAPYGTEIYATNSGTVIEVAYHSADGNYILIDHGGGSATFYSHLSKFSVTTGQSVSQGQIIGYVGMTGWATGYHLNYSIYENSKAVDPMEYYGRT